jgi:Glycosyltransferase family 87/Dolichyl-phosphate-mannose-protein mannosyltransferase
VSVASAARPRLTSRWQTFEGWVGTRASAAVLFVVGLAVFGVQSAVLPAYPGRDMARYLQAFVQLGYHVPVYPAVLNTRGPLAALGLGLPLEIGGWAAEVWLALLYALSILAWSRVALIFGARAAVLTSVVLLVGPGYGILFHQLSSDSLFAAAFAGSALLLSRAVLKPSIRSFVVVGVAIGALVLVRPSNQVLLVMALLPLLLRAPWRARFAWAAASFIAGVVVIQSWHVLAEWRWGDAVVLNPSTGLVAAAVVLLPLLLPPPWRVRLVAAVALLIVAVVAVKGWPTKSPSQYVQSVKQNWSNQFLYRSFELDRIMAPDNGPASRRLAGVVRRELLTREPYRSYGVGVHEFFSSGSDRVFGDLTDVSKPADLADATREAIRRRPATFAKSIGRTIWEEVALRPVYAPLPADGGGGTAARGAATGSGAQYVVVDGRRLPRPSEGQPIPASAIGPLLWTPGGKAYELWTSPTQHHTVITDARDRRRIDRFNRAVDRLAVRIPTRGGDAGLVHRLNQASHVFPPSIAWLVIGAAAFALRRPRRALVALAPAIAALIVIVTTSLVAPSVAEYGAPVSPAFVLLSAAGLFGAPRRGRRRADSKLWRARLASAWPVLAAAVGIAAAAWAVKLYYDDVKGYVDGAGAANDLAVFLSGAGKVLHAASPYAYAGDKTFAYPPFLAWVVAPLHPLSSSAAGLIWLVLSLAAVAAALWLLELRDWRCYALAGVFLFTRSSIELGTIEPVLLLAVAAAWRWRERVLQPALAVGVAIVLKLFLWPLAIWLALMHRGRAALGAVAVALGLAVVSWAAIGFAGLGDYGSVLRRLADDEATSSYSVVALGVRAHLPLTAARILSVLVALALLGAAAWTARDTRRSLRDRDVATLTLTLAAALAASPIVWVHYFLLLLVPLALVRPRLSPLWFVPIAYYPLGVSTWPAGDARKLAIALVATLVILGAAVLPRPRRRFAVGAGYAPRPFAAARPSTGNPSRRAGSAKRASSDVNSSEAG